MRVHIAGCGMLLAALLPGGACAAWPERPVRLVVPFLAGGPGDVTGRIVAPRLAEIWGQQVVVDNRGGANGIVGTELAARAVPDGYTMLLVSASFSVNPTLYRKLPYDSVKDFAPVSPVAVGPAMLVVNPGVPAKNTAELIALAKAKPGTLTFASSGTGAPSHLAGELFKTMAGVDMIHVPYKSMAPGLTDLLGGQVNLSIPTISAVLPHVRSGKLRGLAVTSPRRTAMMPDVPAVAETLPGFEANNWYAILLPVGVPKDIVAKVHAGVIDGLRHPDVRERLAALGMEPQPMAPAEFAAYLRSEIVKWAKVVKASGARAD